jgi:hypothetical protein
VQIGTIVKSTTRVDCVGQVDGLADVQAPPTLKNHAAVVVGMG